MTGVQLKVLRQTMKLTQSQLAQLLGVHVRSLSKWERGVNDVPLSIAKDMERLLFIHDMAEHFKGQQDAHSYKLRAKALMLNLKVKKEEDHGKD